MNLAEISIRRPVFAAMLILGLVVLGLISLGRLELKLDPKIDFPYAMVVTELRGASPETVEREVTQVLEEQVNSIEGIRNLSSTSSEGLSRLHLEFGLDYDIDVKIQEVRDKVALARPLLPIDVEDPVVQKFDLTAVGFLTVVLGGPLGQRELSDFAENEVKERLERVSGVGGVNVVGSRKREIRIWLDPLRLTGYGLSIDDVADTLRRENAELASGRIEGAEREWSVTTQGKAKNVGEFGEIIVAERGGRAVKLRDVAVVEDGMAEAKSIARLNGNPGVALEVQQQSGSDLVAAAREIRVQLDKIRAQAPPGVEITIARDYAKIIEDQISSVLVDMVLAALLVVAVVLLFLRNYRSTLIAGVAIPTSVISSFTLLYALDLSLNSMTLMALSLAVGLVIDDAIVVLESIFRKVEQGQDSMTAALAGSKEVGMAVVSTTLAVCGVFVPIRFMQSTVGRYFFEFGVTVTVAVCVSALVALTLTPMLASRVLRQTPKEGPVFRYLERGLVALERSYERLLHGALRHRVVTALLAAVTVFGGCYVASTLPLNYFTKDDMSEAQVNVKLPIGTPLAVTDRSLREMEAIVAKHPYVRAVFATAGDQRQHEPHKAKLDVLLLPKDERKVPIDTTFEELRSSIVAGVSGLESVTVSHPEYASSSGEGYSEIMYGIEGPNLDRLAFYAHTIEMRMKGDPAFRDVRTSWETGRPEVRLDVDRGRAADVGVSAVALGRTLRTLLAGEKVGSFEDVGERYDVRVQVLPEYRDDPSKIDLIRVRSLDGRARADHERCLGGGGRGAGAGEPAQPRAHDPPVRQHRDGLVALRAGDEDPGLREGGGRRAALHAGAGRPGRIGHRGGARPRVRARPRDGVDLHDPRLALQFDHAPVHDHDVRAALVHRRLPRAQARGHVDGHDERHGAARADGPGDEERHPARGLHQPAARAGPRARRGGPARGARAAATGADDVRRAGVRAAADGTLQCDGRAVSRTDGGDRDRRARDLDGAHARGGARLLHAGRRRDGPRAASLRERARGAAAPAHAAGANDPVAWRSSPTSCGSELRSPMRGSRSACSKRWRRACAPGPSGSASR